MTDTNIFEAPTGVTINDLVGDGKKFKTADDLAKAKIESDAFIARILEEKRQLEADHRAALNLQAFQDRINALEAAQVERREPTPPPTATPAPPAPAGVDEETVQRLIAEREAQNQRTRNLMEVKDKLTSVFGEDYPNRVKARVRDLGISMDQANKMAADTPAAFYAMLGLDRAAPSIENPAPPQTQQNSAAAFVPGTGGKGNSYYQKLRKEKPAEYWSPRVQMEEFNELKRQGPDRFYSS